MWVGFLVEHVWARTCELDDNEVSFTAVRNNSADHTAQFETQQVKERGTVAVTTVWDE